MSGDPVQDWYDEVEAKEEAGTLTYTEAPFGYLLLTSGPHVNRVVSKTHPVANVDGKPVTWFARNLTWVYLDEVKDCTVVRAWWGYP